MPSCTTCGATVDGRANFCAACGAVIENETDQDDPLRTDGFRNFREITLARQLVHFRLESGEEKEEFRKALRAIGDLELRAPFPVRSAFLLRHYEREPFCGEMEGYLYDESLGPDRLPPEGNSFAFVFWKDMRTKLFGKPKDPATYGKWILFGRAEYEELKKRLGL
jgi:hypothetical protein